MAAMFPKSKNAEYCLPYKGADDEKIKISYFEELEEIKIQSTGFVFIEKKNIKWMISVLQNIEKLYERADIKSNK